MTFYAGQLLYCVDKKHSQYGKRIKVDTPLYEAEDGTPALSDVETGNPVDLKKSQISVYAPVEYSNKGKLP